MRDLRPIDECGNKAKMNTDLINVLKKWSSVPLLLGITIWVSLFVARLDMWDGLIVTYASETRNYAGIERLSNDTHLNTVYFLIRGEFAVASVLRISYMRVDRVVVGLALFLICFCTKKIVRDRIKLSKEWAGFAVCALLTFPIWHVLASTTQTFYVVFTSLCMLGVHLIYKNNPYWILPGIILLLISYEMNSAILFAPVLAALYQATEIKTKSFFWNMSKPLLVLTSGCTYWIISNSIDTPTGQYVQYNKLVNPLSMEGWQVIKAGFFEFSSFLILPSLGLSALVAVVLLFRKSSEDEKHTQLLAPIAYVIPLWLASIFPYILVRKSTQVDDFDWFGRHAILLSVPISLGMTIIAHAIVSDLKGKYGRILGIIGASLILLLPQGLLLANGLAAKFGRQEIDIALVRALKTRDIPAGLVEVVGMPTLIPDHRVYESNYLFGKAFGDTSRWTRIAPTSDANFGFSPLTGEPSYQEMYIFHPTENPCRTTIEVMLSQKHTVLDKLKRMLHLSTNTAITVKTVNKVCP